METHLNCILLINLIYEKHKQLNKINWLFIICIDKYKKIILIYLNIYELIKNLKK